MRNSTQRAALAFRMAERRSRAAPMGANGKAKTNNGNEKRECGRRKKSHRRTAQQNRTASISLDGTHRLEGRRDGRGAADGPIGREGNGAGAGSDFAGNPRETTILSENDFSICYTRRHVLMPLAMEVTQAC